MVLELSGYLYGRKRSGMRFQGCKPEDVNFFKSISKMMVQVDGRPFKVLE